MHIVLWYNIIAFFPSLWEGHETRDMRRTPSDPDWFRARLHICDFTIFSSCAALRVLRFVANLRTNKHHTCGPFPTYVSCGAFPKKIFRCSTWWGKWWKKASNVGTSTKLKLHAKFDFCSPSLYYYFFLLVYCILSPCWPSGVHFIFIYLFEVC